MTLRYQHLSDSNVRICQCNDSSIDVAEITGERIIELRQWSDKDVLEALDYLDLGFIHCTPQKLTHSQPLVPPMSEAEFKEKFHEKLKEAHDKNLITLEVKPSEPSEPSEPAPAYEPGSYKKMSRSGQERLLEVLETMLQVSC